jgi:hypothetical protein
LNQYCSEASTAVAPPCSLPPSQPWSMAMSPGPWSMRQPSPRIVFRCGVVFGVDEGRGPHCHYTPTHSILRRDLLWMCAKWQS